MKTLFFLLAFIFTINFSVLCGTEWTPIYGASETEYKISYDKKSIKYNPGVSITVEIKYDYINPETIITAIHKTIFHILENTYDELSKTHIYKDDKSYISEQVNPRKIIPGSDMSIAYQQIYIEAVTLGPRH